MSADQDRLDLNTLQWVKSEIDTTLQQAREALELHVESPEASTQLKLITNLLHQVRGTLQMVELYGAAMLVEELELLAGDIAGRKIDGRDDIYEVMMQAMWQLPDYLERLQFGYKDIPMVLLPLLNDLRAARGQPLLSESALFTPDLDVELPVTSDAGGESLPDLAKKLRHTYHLGLLDWFRERDTQGGLEKLDTVIERLRESANDAEVSRVLWSAGGVLEALKQGGIEPSVAVKLLMGQVDRQIKKIIDHGESALSDEPPAELEKNLLYYVASASSSGERVNELKARFKLAEALPDAETLEQARVDLTGPNAELMQTVSTVLLDNLLQVKDALDVLVRAEVKDLSNLPSMADELAQIADTLGMLGFGKQRETIQEQTTILRAIADGEKALDEAELMGVARVLLSIEGLLQGNVIQSADAAIDLSQELAAESQEYQLIDSVMAEARANMAKVKESLSLYIDMPRNTSLITDVPALLDQIRGSFEMLDMQRPADLIEACRDYIQTAMIDTRRSQDPARMDALADAISSIEYFMDSVAGQWGNPEAILNVAEERLGFIGIEAAAEVAQTAASGPTTKEDVTDTLIEPDTPEALIPQSDDTMIDLGSPDFEHATGEIADSIDIDPTDLSTADLLRADYEKKFANLGPAAATLDETGEIEFDNDLPAADTTREAAVAETVIDTGPAAATLDETREIEFDSDLPAADTTQEAAVAETVIDTGLAAATSDETGEIEFDSDLPEPDISTEPETAEFASETDSPPTLPYAAAEIDFNSPAHELDASVDAFTGESAIVGEQTEVIPNITQEIEFDGTISDINHPADNTGLAELDGVAEDTTPLAQARPTEISAPPISTAEIESQLTEWFQDPGNKKLSRHLQKDIKTIKQFARETDQEDASKIAKDMIAVIKAVQDGTSELTDDIRNILQLANVTLTELFNAEIRHEALKAAPSVEGGRDTGTETGTESVKPDNPASEPARPDEIDDEITEIFIEEAKEEHDNISRLLPVWRADSSDEESLHKMRRSFHTLKGSGRLVGAADIGEFAWAFENMLNRVIDGTVEPGQAMFDLLQQAIDTLPALMGMYVSADKPGQDIYVLMEQAEALSQGKAVGAAGTVNETEHHDTFNETLIIAPPVADSLVPEIDSILLDIYRKEVESHLLSLHGYIDGWRDDVDRTANQQLVRTVHTLTGCSRTAGVDTLADLFGQTERYIQYLAAGEMPLSEESLNLLVRCIDFVEQTVAVLDKPGTAMPDNQALLHEIQALHEKAVAEQATSQDQSNVTRLQPIKPEQQVPAGRSADYDEELLAIFTEEGTEILDESDLILHQLSDDKLKPEQITVMQRLLHTLKGGARLAGLQEMADLSHSIESMLEAMVDGRLDLPEQVYDIILHAQDALVNMLEQVKARKPLTAADDIIAMVDKLLANQSVESVRDDIGASAQPETVTGPDGGPVEQGPAEPAETDNVTSLVPDNVVALTSLKKIEKNEPVRTEAEQPPVERGPAKELVRVRSELLDNLVNFAGEVSIYRSRMEQQTNAFRYNLQELDDTVDRLREQLRKFEMEAEAQIQYRAEELFSHTQEDFDPLEFDRFTQMQQLSRGMMESLNDLDSLRAILAGLTRESETLLVQQSRVNTELQEGLMRTRMVPFSSQANRLRRIVRQTAEELGKKAELQLLGADSEIDRTVLERMLPALEHMLRNAVAHGVESPGQRQKAGKAELGQVNLGLSREGADIVLTLTDDGAGIDLAAIQKKAIEKGKLKPDSHVTRENLFDIIMESGFSTAEEITQIAGRGVGMDVVNNEIKQLGGLLKIDTEQGQGTSFTISLPLTLSLTRALMVQVGEEIYALPLLSVEGVERITTEQLQALYDQDKPVYRWLGQDYPFMHLGSAMGISKPHIPPDRNRIPLLLVRSGDYRAAVQLDSLIGSREIVVKPIGPQLSTMRGIAGATIMGDGSVVLIIDLGVLIRAISIQEELVKEPVAAQVVVEQGEHEPVIMVVDDSITVRKVTTRLLERNHYRAVSAKDGVDALAQLQEMKPDIMLLDVEMPRMDGFELATNVRNDERLKDIPIIMITSRTGQKHRERAERIGVSIYMGKPYGEGELLDNIQSLLEQRH